MLRRVLIASAAAAMLLVTFHPDDAFARRGGGMRAGGFHGGGAMRAGGFRGGAVAVRGGRVAGGYRGAYRAGAYRGYRQGPTAAMGLAATATVSVRRRWAPLRSAPLRRGPTTAAAAATTPTATGFARTTERPPHGFGSAAPQQWHMRRSFAASNPLAHPAIGARAHQGGS